MKFSSGERRATVLLLILTGVLIGVMFLLRSDPSPQTLPTIVPDSGEMVGDTVGPISRVAAEETPKEEKDRRKKADKTARQQKKRTQAASGRKRDFLDEPVKR